MPKIPYAFRLTALDGSALPAPAEERPAPAAAAPAPKPVYQPATPAAPPAPQAAPTAASGGERITAPMPGTILTLNVEPGASVTRSSRRAAGPFSAWTFPCTAPLTQALFCASSPQTADDLPPQPFAPCAAHKNCRLPETRKAALPLFNRSACQQAKNHRNIPARRGCSLYITFTPFPARSRRSVPRAAEG